MPFNLTGPQGIFGLGLNEQTGGLVLSGRAALTQLRGGSQVPLGSFLCTGQDLNFAYGFGLHMSPAALAVTGRVGKMGFGLTGELYPRVGFIVTNMARAAENVVAFYNKRGTCEQWIKEGKGNLRTARKQKSLYLRDPVH